jgi:predicted nucleic acid-binding protein
VVDETWVLDGFAILSLLGAERGSGEVARLLREGQEGKAHLLMTWVNLGEVAYIVKRRWGEGRLHQVLAMLEGTTLEIVPVGRELALAAAHIKADHPVAYADAFAAALASQTGAKLVTGDPEFRLVEDTVRVHWLSQDK